MTINKKGKNSRIYSLSILFIVPLLMILSSTFCFSATLVDYENGSLTSASGGAFRYYQEGYSVLSLETNQGMDGTDRSLNVDTQVQNFHIWWIQNPAQRDLIPEASGADRISFFVKLPENYPISSRGNGDNNFHFGTYTRNPDIVSNQQGSHYYHYFNVQGSAYPIKFVANQRPQHSVSYSGTVENNPESWNYYNGFTRFYLELLPLSGCPIDLPFVSYVDEVKFYHTSEPENDETISSISCTYQGNGLFQIGWHGNSQYEHNGHRYEVRYSTSPITNANYGSATVAPGGPFSRRSDSYNFMLAEFTIQVQDNTRYYFAIKDIDSDIAYVSKIDYPLGDVIAASTAPNANAGADLTAVDTNSDGVQEIILDGSASLDQDGTITQYLWLEDGVQIAQGETATVSLAVGTHNITLRVIDNDGLEGTDSKTIYITAVDSDGPIVSEIEVRSKYYNSASIHWKTSEGANSQVEYGLDTTYGNITSIANSDSPVTSHNIALSELTPGTLYHFRVRSRDASGNETFSNDNTLETLRTQAQEASSIILESDDGWIISTMQIGTDIYASQGKYIAAPSGTGVVSTPVAEVTYNIDIKAAGDYYIWLLMNGPNASNDAMYVGVNGSYDRVYPSQNGQYEWIRVESSNNSGNYAHSLASGMNQIALSHGEELARADKILITRSSLVPQDLIVENPRALQVVSSGN